MDRDVQRYLTGLVDAARAVLGQNLVAAYAGGSIGLDDYQPDRSDVDVTLICEDSLTLEEEIALLGKQDAETREVRLLLVLFDLREVRVVGDVRRESVGDADLHIHAEFALPLVR